MNEGKDFSEADVCEVALKGVEGLPRVSKSEMSSEQQQEAELAYGNNFPLLFLALVYIDRGESDMILDTYIKRAEMDVVAWRTFLSENAQLVEEIKNVVIQRERINVLLKVFMDMMFTSRLYSVHCDRQSTRNYIFELTNSLNLRLNPLLRKAEVAMRKCGVDVDSVKK